MKTNQMKHNGNGTIKNSEETEEIRRLRELLQKTVNKEKAPESLREKLRRHIRE
jgi:hypothetical protein